MRYLINRALLIALNDEVMISFLKNQPKSFHMIFREDMDETDHYQIIHGTEIKREEFYGYMPTVATMDSMDIACLAMLKTMEHTEAMISAFAVKQNPGI